ncbi:hypothetical protein GLOIN_2v1483732 [Rhizophagus irregularis DAOM 181602=DAOM 197198]|uniref:Uncharacterized protein n=1 Tax=Rhizophagus irregularis (strain DAOM 181602 / DAOM 197198 / MUCL 43194) TaxID=747089 RepID=A0A2P4PH11_RHIID|nr:hypothetical protein GLOIN_2v1483732 [Rhizophagus irregularis DAOM 181602=DAOM 197198]POG64679.1 hypothetical protein GLOIN_2v1483732 [Rhizophagus irregularis DAOM 181602=DAOM 197198]|eukprot:XP_025171545.1 hypothetical protein GLOIN_2v1483732 [Rhizophagus irregularis DAOM 181602=DAOM 197198]
MDKNNNNNSNGITNLESTPTETERKKKLNKLIKRYDHLPTKMYHSPLSKTQENKSKFTNTKSLSSIDINVQLSSPEVIKKSTSTPSKTIIEASSITEITNWCSQIQEDSRNSDNIYCKISDNIPFTFIKFTEQFRLYVQPVCTPLNAGAGGDQVCTRFVLRSCAFILPSTPPPNKDTRMS